MKVLLQNIRSAHNVGSIFRTSDAVGVSEIFLGGYTPPIDNKMLVKVALGAEKVVKSTRIWNLGKFFEQKKREGFLVLALELASGAVDYTEVCLSSRDFERCILIVGNEKRGVSKRILGYCDKIIKIPMSGVKESLNVSVAFGVAAFALRDFRKLK